MKDMPPLPLKTLPVIQRLSSEHKKLLFVEQNS